VCGKKPDDKYLVAIVLFGGPLYCANDMPGVYTKVAYFISWIGPDGTKREKSSKRSKKLET
jgi:secreted trypsin-like serine protease